MSMLHLATSAEDSATVTSMIEEQTELLGALGLLVEGLVGAVEEGSGERASAAAAKLMSWLQDELILRLAVRENTLTPAAREDDRARLLVEAMRAQNLTVAELIDALRTAPTPVRAVGDARALEVTFAALVHAEQDQLLPLLAQNSEVSLTELSATMTAHLEEMRAALAEADGEPIAGVPEAAEDGGGHSCGCGGHDEPGLPVLDARVVPHAIRHATVFGALDAVGPDSGLILLAPHDPLPLLGQIEERWPGVFAIDYLESGPETWRIALTR